MALITGLFCTSRSHLQVNIRATAAPREGRGHREDRVRARGKGLCRVRRPLLVGGRGGHQDRLGQAGTGIDVMNLKFELLIRK